jgi:hypothetical protein
MNINPYESSSATVALAPFRLSNRIGQLGFAISMVGFISLFAVGPFGRTISMIAACIAFAALPGLIISSIGLFFRPRSVAAWGVALGIITSLYLPTIYLSLRKIH